VAKYRLITMVNPKEGREAELNEWYDGQHVPDLLTVPGVVSGQRFRVRNPMVPADPICRYMAVFEIDAEDPMPVMAEIRRRSESGEFPLIDAFELASMAIYEALSEPRRP